MPRSRGGPIRRRLPRAGLTDLVRAAEGDPQRPTASIVVALGRSFFQRSDGSARFGGEDRLPAGLVLPLVVAGVSAVNADNLLYAMSPTEAVIADLLRGVAAGRADLITAVEIERGFARDDHRELFGFLDGLRNMPRSARRTRVFINREREAEEPRWTENGTYLAYLKIEQDLDEWNALAVADQEQIMGRRKDDGSRLDLSPGTDPHQEPDQIGDPPAGRSHIRKAGSRLPIHAGHGLFRRGVPYLTLRPDGSADAGLQRRSRASSRSTRLPATTAISSSCGSTHLMTFRRQSDGYARSPRPSQRGPQSSCGRCWSDRCSPQRSGPNRRRPLLRDRREATDRAGDRRVSSPLDQSNRRDQATAHAIPSTGHSS